MARVFLLEDHSWLRKALADLLGRQPDLEVIGEAGSLAEARREAAEKAKEIDLAVWTSCCPTASARISSGACAPTGRGCRCWC